MSGIGKDHYYSRLERGLGREGEDETSNFKQANQQLYFGDDAVKEFHLLFRGKIENA